MDGHTLLWIGFGITVVIVLTLDLAVLHRKPHEIKFKEAALWSAVWIALALVFKLVINLVLDTETGIMF